MNTYIFAQNGYNSTVMAIEAEDEMTARGILQSKTPTGISPDFQGTLDELTDDDNFVNLTRL
jgi:hypothetical protein